MSKLACVAGCLLEVVAENLVQLDQPSAFLDPAGEAFVQLGSCGFWEALVGDVTDQQVAEAEAVVARACTAPR